MRTGLLLLLLAWSGESAARGRSTVLLYDGYGMTSGKAWIEGRVVRGGRLSGAAGREGSFRRFVRNIRMLARRGVPGQEVDLTVLGKTHHVRTDRTGYFRLELKGPSLPAGTFSTSARLRSHPAWNGKGRLSVWPDRPGVVVIVDIDDTVLKSGAQNRLKLVWHSLTSNWRTMESVPGAASLLQKLARNGCPVIFVSSTPLQLYPRLRRFLRGQGFPDAPLVLKNLSRYSLRTEPRFKTDKITSILGRLPHHLALLIGDSGQLDPAIYAAVSRAMPGRVAQVLIRLLPSGNPLHPAQHGFDRYAEAESLLRKRGLLPPP